MGGIKLPQLRTTGLGETDLSVTTPVQGGREVKLLEASRVQESGITGVFVFTCTSAHHSQYRILAAIYLAALSKKYFPIMPTKHN